MKHIFGVSADGHNILEIATSLRESIIELSGKRLTNPKNSIWPSGKTFDFFHFF